MVQVVTGGRAKAREVQRAGSRGGRYRKGQVEGAWKQQQKAGGAKVVRQGRNWWYGRRTGQGRRDNQRAKAANVQVAVCAAGVQQNARVAGARGRARPRAARKRGAAAQNGAQRGVAKEPRAGNARARAQRGVYALQQRAKRVL